MDRLHRSPPPSCLGQLPTSGCTWATFAASECAAETLAAASDDTAKTCSFCGSGLHSKTHELLPFDQTKHLLWSNLFVSCPECARHKSGRWFTELLKPDEVSYESKRYFYFDITTGQLRPHNIVINDWGTTDQSARVTIDTFKLNRSALCLDRKNLLEDFVDGAISELDEFRFLKEFISLN